ncbi:hypothetical protein Vadar_021426 [Vaccinium darrowii]|uniref:Uncharacterized protein n=1 Tax=Vaccinium darrowii TaxID=229202 RepID=A0ACB7Y995_9ERIC|nr:hypothetical protein Vadar_021426 [Vaccinium darrowii]
MGVDYYNMLRVNRNSTNKDLKKVPTTCSATQLSARSTIYTTRRLSIRHHGRAITTGLHAKRSFKVNRRVEEDNIIGELFGGSGDFANTQQPRRSPTGFGSGGKKMAAVENLLGSSLEELYKG